MQNKCAFLRLFETFQEILIVAWINREWSLILNQLKPDYCICAVCASGSCAI